MVATISKHAHTTTVLLRQVTLGNESRWQADNMAKSLRNLTTGGADVGPIKLLLRCTLDKNASFNGGEHKISSWRPKDQAAFCLIKACYVTVSG